MTRCIPALLLLLAVALPASAQTTVTTTDGESQNNKASLSDASSTILRAVRMVAPLEEYEWLALGSCLAEERLNLILSLTIASTESDVLARFVAASNDELSAPLVTCLTEIPEHRREGGLKMLEDAIQAVRDATTETDREIALAILEALARASQVGR